jgi:hypothetical protein
MKLLLALFTALLISACVVIVDRDGTAHASSLAESIKSSMNEDIVLSGDADAAVVNSINGNLRLDDGVEAGKLNTINGRIAVGNNVEVREINSINGEVRGGAGLRVRGDVKTVNGSVQLAEDSRIDGDLMTVNGRVQFTRTEVFGTVRTVNGDIDSGSGSRLRGGLIVEDPRGNTSGDGPTIVIGPQSRVDGDIVFEREGRLFVHASATVGKVTGTTPRHYEGERPQ